MRCSINQLQYIHNAAVLVLLDPAGNMTILAHAVCRGFCIGFMLLFKTALLEHKSPHCLVQRDFWEDQGMVSDTKGPIFVPSGVYCCGMEPADSRSINSEGQSNGVPRALDQFKLWWNWSNWWMKSMSMESNWLPSFPLKSGQLKQKLTLWVRAWDWRPQVPLCS